MKNLIRISLVLIAAVILFGTSSCETRQDKIDKTSIDVMYRSGGIFTIDAKNHFKHYTKGDSVIVGFKMYLAPSLVRPTSSLHGKYLGSLPNDIVAADHEVYYGVAVVL